MIYFYFCILLALLCGIASVHAAAVGGKLGVSGDELMSTALVLRGAERDWHTMPLADGSFVLYVIGREVLVFCLQSRQLTDWPRC